LNDLGPREIVERYAAGQALPITERAGHILHAISAAGGVTT
jgi:hypothetical protein